MARSTTGSLEQIPSTAHAIEAAARRCRKIVMKRALISGAAAVVPIPGVDLAVDLGMLMKMLQQINAEFGLTPEQIEQMAPKRRLSAYKAIAAVGSTVIGRALTREVLSLILKRVARRVATTAAVKYVPLAGQAVAAAISFAALKYIGDRHIDDCVAVAELVNGRRGRARRARVA